VLPQDLATGPRGRRPSGRKPPPEPVRDRWANEIKAGHHRPEFHDRFRTGAKIALMTPPV